MNELAARLDSVSERLNQTSVYISANKDIFIAGEDLWFNAFVLNARDFSLIHTDNTLYLRLQHTETDSTIWQEIIPVSDTQQGIAEATLYDAELRPMATRLVYLHPQQQLNISLSLSKPDCQRKEKLMLKIKTTNPSGRPVPAALSVKATDKLFSNPHNAKDIVSYYYLATQLRGRIYDPAWYFDPSNKDSQSALDLLLLTQGWSRYTWNDENIRATVAQPGRLADSLESYILPVKKAGYKPAPLTLMLFNYNKKNMRVTVTDSSGKFYITPDDLAIGSRFFIKYLSEKEYSIQVSDPFRVINSTIRQKPPITGPFIGTVEGVADLGLLGTRQFNFSVTGNVP
ncbi:hypothetical protein CTE07_42690 [Chitinophaga terrae (ex Kim and Jung 2007)]|nr:hypothetical protein CTE07_42690 [Chitinophaga terrae (ex Kim and Jung 2007)]